MFDSEKVYLGITPTCWTNDDLPTLGDEISFEQCVSEIALAGYQGCSVGHKFPTDPSELKEVLGLRGLRVSEPWHSTYFTLKEMEDKRPAGPDPRPRRPHTPCPPKDIRREAMKQATEEGWSFLDGVKAGVFTVPGDGDIDFPSILQTLADSGFEGWLVVEAEQDPAKAHPLIYAKKEPEYLREVTGL
jgi:sugar phosphate isomerase/epimerase